MALTLTLSRKRARELGTGVQLFERLERFHRFKLFERLKMIGSGTLTKQIAGYLVRTGFDALDDDALRATKEHILYTLGTILAGSNAPGIKQALAGARALSGASQESTGLVTGDKLPAAFRALGHATM